MVDNLNEKKKIQNMRKRKMNKILKFVLMFLIIVSMIAFFIYLTMYFIRHPEGVSGIIG